MGAGQLGTTPSNLSIAKTGEKFSFAQSTFGNVSSKGIRNFLIEPEDASAISARIVERFSPKILKLKNLGAKISNMLNAAPDKAEYSPSTNTFIVENMPTLKQKAQKYCKAQAMQQCSQNLKDSLKIYSLIDPFAKGH